MSGRMPRPYVDRPEPEPPNPVRRRTGSFPVRSLSGDNQQPILPPGTRPPRRFVATSARVFVDEGSDDYRTAPAAVPGFSREGTFGNQSQPWHRQDSGVQYVGGYLPADAPPPNASEWIYERTPYLYRPRRTTSRNSPEDVPFLGGGERLYRSRSPSPEQAPDRRAAVEIRAKRARRYSSSDDEGDPSSDQEEEDRELRQRSATFSDDVSVVDDYIAAKVYQFSPSRLSRNPSDEPSIATAGSDGEGPPPDADQGLSDQDEVPPPTKATRVLDVYLSEYTGDAYADGSHSARLTAVHDPKKAKQPLFRWIHIKQSTLDFDALSIDIARLSGLADSDKNGLAKLLAEVKKTCIKTTPSANGTNIKWMEPKFVQVPLPPDQISKGRNSPVRFVTWLCIPYFSLEKYSGPLSTAQSATFPTQTLLQAQYSGVPKDRDMQQVVCQLGHVPPETCFHINQLWCIVLDNSLLVTCGTTAAETALQSDIIQIVTKPPRQPSGSGTFIYVYFTEAVLWALPLDDCRTWFAFISHFHEFWPQTLFFSHRDRPVNAADWPRTANLARHSSYRVVLHLKTGPPPQPPPRGILLPIGKGRKDVDKKSVEETQKNLKLPQKDKANVQPVVTERDDVSDKGEDNFHIFSWLETVLSTGDPDSRVQVEMIRMQLQEVEDYLKSSTSFSDRRAYQDCQEATRVSCFSYLEEQAALTEKFKKQTVMKQQYEDRIDIMNAADIVFRFFLPSDLEGPTVGKFWGAIYALVQMPQEPDNRTGRSQRRRSRGTRNTEGNVPMMMSYLKRLTQGVQSFKNIISYAQPFDRASITVPDSLIRAWLHLLMSLIYSTQSAFAWSEHCEVTRLLLTEGMAEVMDQISNESLINRAAVLPMEVVSLLGLVLLHDSTGAYPDLGASYSEYLDALGNQIATRPSDRSFQHRISLLKQEIGVIQKTVAAQNGVFNSIVQFSSRHQLPAGNLNTDPRSRERMMSMYYNRDITPTGRGPRYMALEKKDPYSDYARRGPREKMYVHRDYYYSGGGVQDDWVLSPGEFYKLSPTYPGGFRELLAGDCLSLLDRRIREFGEFELHANDLKEENLSNFEDTKDRQELAIYAFTIVTVVFLPLSFVAGVFGMNTSDIRDMTQGQWAYWASAIPVTVLVILIGLWWMGELANLFSWLLPRSGSRVTAAYGIAPRNPRNSGLRGSRGRALDVLPPPYEVDAMPSDFRQRPGTYRY